MTRDHDVERPDRGSSCRQLGTDLASVFGAAEVKVEKLETPKQALYDVQVAPDGLRFMRAAPIRSAMQAAGSASAYGRRLAGR